MDISTNDLYIRLCKSLHISDHTTSRCRDGDPNAIGNECISGIYSGQPENYGIYSQRIEISSPSQKIQENPNCHDVKSTLGIRLVAILNPLKKLYITNFSLCTLYTII